MATIWYHSAIGVWCVRMNVVCVTSPHTNMSSVALVWLFSARPQHVITKQGRSHNGHTSGFVPIIDLLVSPPAFPLSRKWDGLGTASRGRTPIITTKRWPSRRYEVVRPPHTAPLRLRPHPTTAFMNTKESYRLMRGRIRLKSATRPNST